MVRVQNSDPENELPVKPEPIVIVMPSWFKFWSVGAIVLLVVDCIRLVGIIHEYAARMFVYYSGITPFLDHVPKKLLYIILGAYALDDTSDYASLLFMKDCLALLQVLSYGAYVFSVPANTVQSLFTIMIAPVLALGCGFIQYLYYMQYSDIVLAIPALHCLGVKAHKNNLRDIEEFLRTRGCIVESAAFLKDIFWILLSFVLLLVCMQRAHKILLKNFEPFETKAWKEKSN